MLALIIDRIYQLTLCKTFALKITKFSLIYQIKEAVIRCCTDNG